MQKYCKLCSAFGCHKKAELYKTIGDIEFAFCKAHINLIDYGSTMMILDIISDTKQDIVGLKNMINFKNIGYSENELDNTINYLISIGELAHDGSILITRQALNSCKFYGCKLKRRTELYCANHKNLPPINDVDKILESIRLSPKTIKQINIETNIPNQKIKMTLNQLIKFGYVNKEKHGVTNYYMRV